jgi:hypothetical protein
VGISHSLMRFLSIVIGLGALGLAAVPSSATASTNCCFELAVNVRQNATLEYRNDLPQSYHGSYGLYRYWSVRSIVAYHETFLRHRPSLIDRASEARLATIELGNVTERHARIDENGNPYYTYEPLGCKPYPPSFGTYVESGLDSQPAPISGAVALKKEGKAVRFRFGAASLFDTEPRECYGGGDLGLHRQDGADSPTFEVQPPKRRFLRSADASDQHVSKHFDFPTIEITHGGVAGIHTFQNFGEARVRLRWFPESRIKGERQRLRDLQCGQDPQHRLCKDDWGE